MSTRSDLRAQVFDIAGDDCEWPNCGRHATELAHLEARGMSPVGKDRLDNVMAACPDHARITDLELPEGANGVAQLRAELVAIGVVPFDPWLRKRLVAVLRAHLAESRSFIDPESL